MITWYRNQSIAKKLGLAFATTAVLTLAIALFAMYRMHSLSDMLEETATNSVPSVEQLDEARVQLALFRIAETGLAFTRNDAARRDDLKKRLSEARAAFDKQIQTYAPSISSPKEKEFFDAEQASAAKYFAAHE